MSEFYWTTESWGRALRSAALLDLAPHFFTTRDLPLGIPGQEPRDAYARIAAAAGVEPARVARLRQVHGSVVVRADTASVAQWDGERPDGDALVSDDPGVALSVRVADCVPTLLASPGGAVAAAHGGWRGTAASIAAQTVRALERLGTRPRDIVAAAGPSIGPCCYVVGELVRDAFRAAGHAPDHLARWFVEDDGSLRLDLWTATADQLQAAGVFCHNVHVSRLCTSCHPELFFSYRAEGAGTGRIEGVIRARGQ